MTAVAIDTARFPAPSQSDAVSAALLALGAAALFLGTLFYARLTPALGLPALPDERAQALADALTLGPRNWRSPAALRSSAMACCSPPASPWLQGADVRRATSNEPAGL